MLVKLSTMAIVRYRHAESESLVYCSCERYIQIRAVIIQGLAYAVMVVLSTEANTT